MKNLQKDKQEMIQQIKYQNVSPIDIFNKDGDME